jgi:hypothetical protein
MNMSSIKGACHEKYLPDIRKHALLMSSVFYSICRCEKLFGLMKNVGSVTRTRFTYEHSEGRMQIAELNVLLKDYSSSSSVRYLTDD